MWKKVVGDYYWEYRVNEDGIVQRYWKGKWRDMSPSMSEDGYPRMYMCLPDKQHRREYLSKIVWEAFRGPVPAGMVIARKNSMRSDCNINNLFLTTREERGRTKRTGNSRPVEKVAPDGEVVAIYPSAAAAARANYFAESHMRAHCLGKIADRYRMDGFLYRYEDCRKTRSRKGETDSDKRKRKTSN